MNRRRFLIASGGSALVALGLVGCSGKDTSAPSSSPGTTAGAGASGPRGSVRPGDYPYELRRDLVLGFDREGRAYTVTDERHRISQQGGWAIGAPGNEAGQFSGPMGLVAIGRELFIIDKANSRLVVLSTDDGTIVREIDGPAGGEPFNAPSAVIAAGGDRLLVADTVKHRVIEIDLQGKLVRSLGTPGTEVGQLNGPRALAVDAEGDLLVLDHNRRVTVFDPAGQVSRSFGTGPASALRMPVDLTIDGTGQVHVADAVQGVLRFAADGTFIARATQTASDGTPISPEWLLTGPDGSVLVGSPAGPT